MAARPAGDLLNTEVADPSIMPRRVNLTEKSRSSSLRSFVRSRFRQSSTHPLTSEVEHHDSKPRERERERERVEKGSYRYQDIEEREQGHGRRSEGRKGEWSKMEEKREGIELQRRRSNEPPDNKGRETKRKKKRLNLEKSKLVREGKEREEGDSIRLNRVLEAWV